MKVPEFDTKEQALDWLKANKETVMKAKKAEMKKADGVLMVRHIDTDLTDKAYKPIENIEDIDSVNVRAIINTTNLMDSHDDVHMPGLWKKSLKENRDIMHLQEHELRFDHIISDGEDLKAFTQDVTWKSLGFAYPGTTEALTFDSNVKRERNEFMFKNYAKARVKQHSVGMYYVKIFLAVDSEDDYWKEQRKVWNQYIDQVVNRERAETKGYFYVVTEAKLVEGSAVPLGSNWATPTTDNDLKSEPVQTTQDEPPQGTLKLEDRIKLINEFKIF